MLLDARQVGADGLSTPVCIIGAGAAGIAIAREFHRAGLECLLLESGGFDFEEDTQDLYAGRTTGVFTDPKDVEDYQVYSRLRLFGGTTAIWSGWCRPLDPMDFEVRDWVPLSGWPIGHDDLVPYYSRAAAMAQVNAFDGQELIREPPLRRRSLVTEQDVPGFDTRMFYYANPAPNFGLIFRAELARSPTVSVLLHANAVELEADANATSVQTVRIGVLGGTGFRVKADRFVLATGGIENARLLLNSDGVAPGGLGNGSGWVGRCFMEHPHVVVGEYALWDGAAGDESLYFSYTKNAALGHMSHGGLCSTPAFQRERRTLNFCCQVVRPRETDPQLGRFFETLRRCDGNPAEPWTTAPVHGLLQVQAEHSPNPESGVRLVDERDALGARRVHLEWRLRPTDLDSIHESLLALAKYLERTRRGRLRMLIDREAYSSLVIRGGSHHLGTTRMSSDPSRGVVDANCRVHGIRNLWVAGSSVYCTSGFANPTLTLLALALRLGEHLTRR